MKTDKEGALRAMYSNPTGRECSINDTVYFGVGSSPYATIYDLGQAGCKFTSPPITINEWGVFGLLSNKNLWGHLNDKNEGAKFIEWLLKRDGYLYIYQ